MKRLILALIIGSAFAAPSAAYAAVKSVVPVHGAFADGSGWKPVADILMRRGYSVRVVQEPLDQLRGGRRCNTLRARQWAKSQALELPGSHAIFLSHPH